ncbi:hypothetical protein DL93DRAFT_2168407 [Clavulina sp. PMI_390]|nr:hypothetical protein DL93DRAFT_2168407 [Clavulina sp. PMI_390]
MSMYIAADASTYLACYHDSLLDALPDARGNVLKAAPAFYSASPLAPQKDASGWQFGARVNALRRPSLSHLQPHTSGSGSGGHHHHHPHQQQQQQPHHHNTLNHHHHHPQHPNRHSPHDPASSSSGSGSSSGHGHATDDVSTDADSLGGYDILRKWEDCLDLQRVIEKEYLAHALERRNTLHTANLLGTSTTGNGSSGLTTTTTTQSGSGSFGSAGAGSGGGPGSALGVGTFYSSERAASFDSLPSGNGHTQLPNDPLSITLDVHALIPTLSKKPKKLPPASVLGLEPSPNGEILSLWATATPPNSAAGGSSSSATETPKPKKGRASIFSKSVISLGSSASNAPPPAPFSPPATQDFDASPSFPFSPNPSSSSPAAFVLPPSAKPLTSKQIQQALLAYSRHEEWRAFLIGLFHSDDPILHEVRDGARMRAWFGWWRSDRDRVREQKAAAGPGPIPQFPPSLPTLANGSLSPPLSPPFLTTSPSYQNLPLGSALDPEVDAAERDKHRWMREMGYYKKDRKYSSASTTTGASATSTGSVSATSNSTYGLASPSTSNLSASTSTTKRAAAGTSSATGGSSPAFLSFGGAVGGLSVPLPIGRTVPKERDGSVGRAKKKGPSRPSTADSAITSSTSRAGEQGEPGPSSSRMRHLSMSTTSYMYKGPSSPPPPSSSPPPRPTGIPPSLSISDLTPPSRTPSRFVSGADAHSSSTSPSPISPPAVNGAGGVSGVPAHIYAARRPSDPFSQASSPSHRNYASRDFKDVRRGKYSPPPLHAPFPDTDEPAVPPIPLRTSSSPALRSLASASPPPRFAPPPPPSSHPPSPPVDSYHHAPLSAPLSFSALGSAPPSTMPTAPARMLRAGPPRPRPPPSKPPPSLAAPLPPGRRAARLGDELLVNRQHQPSRADRFSVTSFDNALAETLAGFPMPPSASTGAGGFPMPPSNGSSGGPPPGKTLSKSRSMHTLSPTRTTNPALGGSAGAVPPLPPTAAVTRQQRSDSRDFPLVDEVVTEEEEDDDEPNGQGTIRPSVSAMRRRAQSESHSRMLSSSAMVAAAAVAAAARPVGLSMRRPSEADTDSQLELDLDLEDEHDDTLRTVHWRDARHPRRIPTDTGLHMSDTSKEEHEDDGVDLSMAEDSELEFDVDLNDVRALLDAAVESAEQQRQYMQEVQLEPTDVDADADDVLVFEDLLDVPDLPHLSPYFGVVTSDTTPTQTMVRKHVNGHGQSAQDVAMGFRDLGRSTVQQNHHSNEPLSSNRRARPSPAGHSPDQYIRDDASSPILGVSSDDDEVTEEGTGSRPNPRPPSLRAQSVPSPQPSTASGGYLDDRSSVSISMRASEDNASIMQEFEMVSPPPPPYDSRFFGRHLTATPLSFASDAQSLRHGSGASLLSHSTNAGDGTFTRRSGERTHAYSNSVSSGFSVSSQHLSQFRGVADGLHRSSSLSSAHRPTPRVDTNQLPLTSPSPSPSPSASPSSPATTQDQSNEKLRRRVSESSLRNAVRRFTSLDFFASATPRRSSPLASRGGSFSSSPGSNNSGEGPRPSQDDSIRRSGSSASRRLSRDGHSSEWGRQSTRAPSSLGSSSKEPARPSQDSAMIPLLGEEMSVIDVGVGSMIVPEEVERGTPTDPLDHYFDGNWSSESPTSSSRAALSSRPTSSISSLQQSLRPPTIEEHPPPDQVGAPGHPTNQEPSASPSLTHAQPQALASFSASRGSRPIPPPLATPAPSTPLPPTPLDNTLDAPRASYPPDTPLTASSIAAKVLHAATGTAVMLRLGRHVSMHEVKEKARVKFREAENLDVCVANGMTVLSEDLLLYYRQLGGPGARDSSILSPGRKRSSSVSSMGMDLNPQAFVRIWSEEEFAELLNLVPPGEKLVLRLVAIAA